MSSDGHQNQHTWRVGKTVKKSSNHQRKSCNTCYRSKTRCDRLRPVCSTCNIFARICTYPERIGQSDTSSTTSFITPASKASTQPTDNSTSSKTSRSRSNTSTQSTTTTGFSGISSQDDSQHNPAISTSNHADTSNGIRNGNGSNEMFKPDFIAVALINALASHCDRDSSSILAAIRLGMPLADIYCAITSGHNLQDHLDETMSRNKTREATNDAQQCAITPNILIDPEIASSIFDRDVWTNFRHVPKPRRKTAQAQELVGSGTIRTIDSTSPRKEVDSSPSTVDSDFGEPRLPLYCILPMRLETTAADPYDTAYALMLSEISSGVTADTYCGIHVNIGALVYPDKARLVPRLSQIVAELTRSMKPYESNTSITSLALMYIHWTFWAWLLFPSKESYERMPTIIRPSPWQLLSPHILVYDLLIDPTLRDFCCREPRHDNQWLLEASKTIECDIPLTALHAMCRHPKTREIDLSEACKIYVNNTTAWSLGPAVRANFPHMDQYMKIRTSSVRDNFEPARSSYIDARNPSCKALSK